MLYTRFLNRDRECFGSALANYFDMNGEENLAERVYEQFRKHPFVAADGSMHALLCTRMVQDLTEGKYSGILQYGNFRGDTKKSLEISIGNHANEALQTIMKEIEERRLRGGLKRIEYIGEALVLQGLAERDTQHWIVDCDDGTVINDGKIKDIVDTQVFFSTLNAVLKIQLT